MSLEAENVVDEKSDAEERNKTLKENNHAEAAQQLLGEIPKEKVDELFEMDEVQRFIRNNKKEKA